MTSTALIASTGSVIVKTIVNTIGKSIVKIKINWKIKVYTYKVVVFACLFFFENSQAAPFFENKALVKCSRILLENPLSKEVSKKVSKIVKQTSNLKTTYLRHRAMEAFFRLIIKNGLLTNSAYFDYDAFLSHVLQDPFNNFFPLISRAEDMGLKIEYLEDMHNFISFTISTIGPPGISHLSSKDHTAVNNVDLRGQKTPTCSICTCGWCKEHYFPLVKSIKSHSLNPDQFIPEVYFNEVRQFHLLGKDYQVPRFSPLLLDGNTGAILKQGDGTKLIESIIQRTQEINKNSVFAMIDVGALGKVNYFAQGYEAGDEYLRQVARVVRKNIREEDFFIFKIGGDEFVFIIPNVALADGKEILQRMSNAVFSDPDTNFVFDKERTNLSELIDQIKSARTYKDFEILIRSHAWLRTAFDQQKLIQIISLFARIDHLDLTQARALKSVPAFLDWMDKQVLGLSSKTQKEVNDFKHDPLLAEAMHYSQKEVLLFLELKLKKLQDLKPSISVGFTEIHPGDTFAQLYAKTSDAASQAKRDYLLKRGLYDESKYGAIPFASINGLETNVDLSAYPVVTEVKD